MHGSADQPEVPVSPEHVGAPPEPPAQPLTHHEPAVGAQATGTLGHDGELPADSTTVFSSATEAAPPTTDAPATPAHAEPEPEPEPEPAPTPAPTPEPAPVASAAQLAEPLAVHHIGIAVSSIDQAMQFYGEKLGLSVASRVTMPERSLKVAFVRAGNTLIELLEPTSDSSTVARFIERRGPGLHHLCFGTPDIVEHLRDLKDKGVELIDDAPRPGGLGSVAFIQPAAAHGVLVELLQERLPDAEAPY